MQKWHSKEDGNVDTGKGNPLIVLTVHVYQVQSVPLGDVSAQETSVAHVRSTHVTVESTGVFVKSGGSCHALTNHYIKESRPFFPNEKLPGYIDVPFFYGLARLVWFASLFGFLAATGMKSKYPFFLYFPLGFFIACLLFFFIYCQHEWVHKKSFPVVLKQPIIDSQKTENDFYEVTLTELDGMALQNYESGVGFVQLTQGKIQFQAFNRNAIRNMLNSKRRSRWMLFLFFASSLYNCYVMVSYTFGAGLAWF